MKVLYIYVNTTLRASYPIGLAHLASHTKSIGHDVKIFDTTFYKNNAETNRENVREKIGMYKPVENPIERTYVNSDLMVDLLALIGEFRPDIIGFSVMSSEFYFACGVSRRIKEAYPDVPIIFGGLHPSLCPEETINEPSVDMLCMGEGEYVIAELLEKLHDKEKIKSIKNLWIKEKHHVFKNPLRELLVLDDLPLLDWSLFSEQHIYAPLNGRMRRIGAVEFSRGCPYVCNYCSCTALRNLTAPQKYLRHKSIDRAISDMVFLKKKYNVEMFYFLDETFLSMDIDVFKSLAKEYKNQVGIPFYGMTHPASVTEEKVKILEEMGCYLMTIGIEVGNEKFRADILNRRVKNSTIINAFDIFHKSAVLPSAFAMIGLPFETRELVFDTVELFRRCRPETYAVGIFKPFIGSKLRQVCIERGFYDPANDNYNYPVHTSVLNMPQFPKEEIEKLYKTFVLYTKVKKEDYPMVQKAETDEALLKELLQQYCS